MLRWHVGDVIRKMRENRDWNQETLAEHAGLNKATVVRIEGGRETKTKTIQKIASALGVDVSVLFGLIPKEKLRDESSDASRAQHRAYSR